MVLRFFIIFFKLISEPGCSLSVVYDQLYVLIFFARLLSVRTVLILDTQNPKVSGFQIRKWHKGGSRHKN